MRATAPPDKVPGKIGDSRGERRHGDIRAGERKAEQQDQPCPEAGNARSAVEI